MEWIHLSTGPHVWVTIRVQMHLASTFPLDNSCMRALVGQATFASVAVARQDSPAQTRVSQYHHHHNDWHHTDQPTIHPPTHSRAEPSHKTTNLPIPKSPKSTSRPPEQPIKLGLQCIHEAGTDQQTPQTRYTHMTKCLCCGCTASAHAPNPLPTFSLSNS